MAGRPRTEISKEWLQSKVDSGMNDKEIATSLSHQGTSVSAKTIQRRRIEFGVRTKRRRIGTDTPSPLSGSCQFAPLTMSSSLSDSHLLRGNKQPHHLHTTYHHRTLSFDEDEEVPRKIRSPSQTRTPSPLPTSSSTPSSITSSSSHSSSSLLINNPLVPTICLSSSSSSVSIPSPDSNSSIGSPMNNSVKSINHSTPMISFHSHFVAHNLSKSISSPSLLSSPATNEPTHGLHTTIPTSSSSSNTATGWLDVNQASMMSSFNRPAPNETLLPPSSFQYHHHIPSPSPHHLHHIHKDNTTHISTSSSASTSSPSHEPSSSSTSSLSSPYTFMANPRPLPSLQSILNNNHHTTTICSPEPRRTTTTPSSPLTSSPTSSRLNINSLLSETGTNTIDHMGDIAWLSPVQIRKASPDETQNRSPQHTSTSTTTSTTTTTKNDKHTTMNNDNMMDVINTSGSFVDTSSLDRETAECARQLQRISTTQQPSHPPPSFHLHQPFHPPQFPRHDETHAQHTQGGGGRVSSIHSVLSMRN